MEESLAGVHGSRTLSRRYGKAPFEGHRRPGQSCIHGQYSGVLFLSIAAKISKGI